MTDTIEIFLQVMAVFCLILVVYMVIVAIKDTYVYTPKCESMCSSRGYDYYETEGNAKCKCLDEDNNLKVFNMGGQHG